jgi:hypothetical protein
VIADLRGLSGLSTYGLLDRVTRTREASPVPSRVVPASPDARPAALASPDATPTDIGAPLAQGTAREPISQDSELTCIARPTIQPRKLR